jgi:3-hydroxyacyl-CoA dehydrogenase
MITSGNPVNGEKAAELGIVDAVATGDVRADAIAFARQVVADNRGPRRISGMTVAGDAVENKKLIEDYRAKLQKTSRGLLAPFHCLESVANSVTLSFDEGWAREAEISRTAMVSTESRSLVHAFFAERQVTKIPDIPADIALRPVNKAAIIGAGTMGGGIAMSFANAGIPVTVIEASQENLDRGMGRMAANYDTTRKRGRLSDEEMAARLGRINSSTDYADMADADIVIEAVFEEMDVKRAVFTEIDQQGRRGGRCVRRLRRQSHAGALFPSGRFSGRRRRAAAGCGPGDRGIWLPHGPVPGIGSGRARHQLGHRETPCRNPPGR